ncbi:hypothetical protein Vadar_014652 [Vaccinium darrowii]|uniref:Uncharacterized protein n=1 Tax=Vaccinium darrowii TaxID=229202 RepID=A0ACB7XA03_9ERIC|nr:hypothetical protein Vadar_014652 [Vaccinium darrowii]
MGPNVTPNGSLSYSNSLAELIIQPWEFLASIKRLLSCLSFMCCKCRERSNWTFYGVAFSCSQEAEKDSKVGLLD